VIDVRDFGRVHLSFEGLSSFIDEVLSNDSLIKYFSMQVSESLEKYKIKCIF